MSFRDRSIYHNVHCSQEAKVEHSYPDLNPSHAENAHTISASGKHLAVVWATRDGASVGILSLKDVGKRNWTVPLYHGHSRQILDIAFHPYHDNLLATGGEDELVKLFKIPDEGLREATGIDAANLIGHNGSVQSIRFNPSAENVIASGGTDSAVRVWDIMKQQTALNTQVSDSIWDLGWNEEGSLIAAVTKDKKLQIIDPRKENVAQETNSHEGTKPSKVIWLTNCYERVLSTGFTKYRDRQVSIWDLKALSKPLNTISFDSSPGVITPLFDGDTGLLFLAGRGEATIRVFDLKKPRLPFYEELSTGRVIGSKPQQDVCLVPKRALNVTDLEVARVFRLTDNAVIPVHFTIARKIKDHFAHDLFPDTASACSLTADKWFAGINHNPIVSCLRPHGTS